MTALVFQPLPAYALRPMGAENRRVVTAIDGALQPPTPTPTLLINATQGRGLEEGKPVDLVDFDIDKVLASDKRRLGTAVYVRVPGELRIPLANWPAGTGMPLLLADRTAIINHPDAETFEVSDGSNKNNKAPLRGTTPVFLGRAPSTPGAAAVVIADKREETGQAKVSQKHLRVALEGSAAARRMSIQDLGSTYGTFVSEDVLRQIQQGALISQIPEIVDQIRRGERQGAARFTRLAPVARAEVERQIRRVPKSDSTLAHLRLAAKIEDLNPTLSQQTTLRDFQSLVRMGERGKQFVHGTRADGLVGLLRVSLLLDGPKDAPLAEADFSSGPCFIEVNPASPLSRGDYIWIVPDEAAKVEAIRARDGMVASGLLSGNEQGVLGRIPVMTYAERVLRYYAAEFNKSVRPFFQALQGLRGPGLTTTLEWERLVDQYGSNNGRLAGSRVDRLASIVRQALAEDPTSPTSALTIPKEYLLPILKGIGSYVLAPQTQQQSPEAQVVTQNQAVLARLASRLTATTPRVSVWLDTPGNILEQQPTGVAAVVPIVLERQPSGIFKYGVREQDRSQIPQTFLDSLKEYKKAVTGLEERGPRAAGLQELESRLPQTRTPVNTNIPVLARASALLKGLPSSKRGIVAVDRAGNIVPATAPGVVGQFRLIRQPDGTLYVAVRPREGETLQQGLKRLNPPKGLMDSLKQYNNRERAVAENRATFDQWARSNVLQYGQTGRIRGPVWVDARGNVSFPTEVNRPQPSGTRGFTLSQRSDGTVRIVLNKGEKLQQGYQRLLRDAPPGLLNSIRRYNGLVANRKSNYTKLYATGFLTANLPQPGTLDTMVAAVNAAGRIDAVGDEAVTKVNAPGNTQLFLVAFQKDSRGNVTVQQVPEQPPVPRALFDLVTAIDLVQIKLTTTIENGEVRTLARGLDLLSEVVEMPKLAVGLEETAQIAAGLEQALNDVQQTPAANVTLEQVGLLRGFVTAAGRGGLLIGSRQTELAQTLETVLTAPDLPAMVASALAVVLGLVSSRGLEESLEQQLSSLADIPLNPAQIAQLRAKETIVTPVRGIDSRVSLIGVSADAVPAALEGGRLVAVQPGLLPDGAETGLQRLGAVQPLRTDQDLQNLILQLSQMPKDAPKGLVLVDPPTAQKLRDALAEMGSKWQEPVVIVGIQPGMLRNVNPNSVLVYLLNLLAQAADVPGRQIQLLEATFTLELEKQTFFLNTSA